MVETSLELVETLKNAALEPVMFTLLRPCLRTTLQLASAQMWILTLGADRGESVSYILDPSQTYVNEVVLPHLHNSVPLLRGLISQG